MDLDNNAAASADGALSVSDAARMLANSRREKQAPATPDPERDDDVAADEPAYESFEADEALDAAPDDSQLSGEDEGEDPAEQRPSVEPPRSWTKQAKQHFASLPPETQKELLEQDRSRELEVRKSQNEAAELRRQHDTRMQAVEQQRQQYEALLPRVHQMLQGQHAEQFADIQTPADVQRLAREEPLRYIEWDASRKAISDAQQEWEAAQRRQADEARNRWNAFVTEQDKLVREKIPEYTDPQKASKEVEQVRRYLTEDAGLSSDEFEALWDGRDGINLRDHRARLIIRDAMRYRAAQKAVKTAQPKLVPPVQRPGAAPPRNSPATEIQALERAFQQNPTAKNGAALQAAKRRAATRPRQ